MKKAFISILASVVFALQFIAPVAMAVDYLPVRAYANDTVAGYPAALKSSLLTPGQNVVFVVEKPDGAIVKVPAKADLDGIAAVELYGHQTKTAGDYKVALVYPGLPTSSPQSAFSVHPDKVSEIQSTVNATNQLVVADKTAKTFVTVTLYDSYRNPISGHLVKLISSRTEDTIEILDGGGVTDNAGQANFKVTSAYPGISVFTALDSTLNVILDGRAEVVFQSPTKEKEIGGSLLRANLLDANVGNTGSAVGPANHFDIVDLPATVKVNAEISPTVVAKDKDGNIAKNYAGTVLFAVPDDEHAVLPNNGEYTFKENNQGRFTFNLALQFSALGRQTLQVFDKDNWDIKGEAEVDVVSENTVSPAAMGTNLIIKAPADGAQLGNSFIVISGQGEPNVNLKVFDNDVRIGDSETDEDGFFSFEARGLQSGIHTFYVMSNQGDVSLSINVHIDTLPPVLNGFSVYPDGTVDPGQPLDILVESEPDLEEVKIRIQGVTEILDPGADPGSYGTTIAAPVTEGNFSVDVILTDKLANRAELLNQVTVKVAKAAPVGPPLAEGLTGEAGDGSVSLGWQAVKGHSNPISHYRVYYGNHFDRLSQTVETDGAVTDAVIGDLSNDTQYFFAVKAVDNKGVESGEMSLIIAVTPVAPPVDVPHSAALPGGGFTATPLDSAIHISWLPFTGVTAYYYKVYFGLQPGQYEDYVVTANNATQVMIRDLMNSIPYYFSVVALDLVGQEVSALSAEFSAVPGSGGLYGSAPAAPLASMIPSMPTAIYAPQFSHMPKTNETGVETLWIIAISLMAAGCLYQLRQNLIKKSKSC